MGITDDVFLSSSAQVTITDPWCARHCPILRGPNSASAWSWTIISAETQEGTVSGTIQPGDIRFSKKVKIQAGQSEQVSFQLEIERPQLWWPNGYGSQPLYTCDLKFTVGENISDEKKITFGVKQYSYDALGGVLHIHINGRRIFVKGSNGACLNTCAAAEGIRYQSEAAQGNEL